MICQGFNTHRKLLAPETTISAAINRCIRERLNCPWFVLFIINFLMILCNDLPGFVFLRSLEHLATQRDLNTSAGAARTVASCPVSSMPSGRDDLLCRGRYLGHAALEQVGGPRPPRRRDSGHVSLRLWLPGRRPGYHDLPRSCH